MFQKLTSPATIRQRHLLVSRANCAVVVFHAQTNTHLYDEITISYSRCVRLVGGWWQPVHSSQCSRGDIEGYDSGFAYVDFK